MSKTLNVVVLAAGRGLRFADSEWAEVPKPLIELRGQTLLGHSLDLAHEIRRGEGRVVVVTTEAVAGHAATMLSRQGSRDRVVPVAITQRGPAASGLLAAAFLEPEEPVVFMDCDNFYAHANRGDWLSRLPVGESFLTVADVPAGLQREAFCNVRLAQSDADGIFIVVDIKEKEACGGFTKVATGIYGFQSFASFQHAAFSLLRPRDYSELPMSRTLYCADPRGDVVAVAVAGWQPVGTPAQIGAAVGIK